MLFNSIEFIFFFLPITLFVFFAVAKYKGNEAAIFALVAASLFFYGWWNPSYLIILIGSMLLNYKLGGLLNKNRNKSLLIFGISLNLALIIYYKYAGFMANNWNFLTGSSLSFGEILLPLAISFFTFQQIAYLVDSYKGITSEYKFLHYALFVSFFPQLIAGPIVHHKQMLPQFSSNTRYQLNTNHLKIGLSIFAIGLFKKTVLADGVAVYATPVFTMVDSGQDVDMLSAWGGALAYTLQLYFDFSGYSDMAIGLARIFGIVLPLNFYSPYKATSISEFWRRWHITLSTFLRDYIYIALGGNRNGKIKRYTNLFITMLLGGLWHGAGWNFIIWGALHGSYLIVNHGWRSLLERVPFLGFTRIKTLSWLITFLAVVVGWVFFRATTLDGALSMLASMVGANGIELPNAIMSRLGGAAELLQGFGIQAGNTGGSAFILTWIWIICLMFIAICMPNVQDIFAKAKPSLSQQHFVTSDTFWPLLSLARKVSWADTTRWALFIGIILALGLLTLNQVSEFLYFQF
ncbi:MBOAT family O-acyltransferase [Glaciecola sp. 2405UD65-10]|uniref:MBOAT family O-acyltransferase n=1 Tax=Glaciecola sp. 2405UD65-10 TaxID=3397244 RepID=UPI003B59AA89